MDFYQVRGTTGGCTEIVLADENAHFDFEAKLFC